MNTRLQAQCRVPTPLGPLTLAATEAGLAGAWFDGQKHHPGALAAATDPAQPHLACAAAEIAAYFEGRLQHFTVPLDPAGTAFQRQVWQALRRIPWGALSGYGALAAAIGRAGAARAVGAAVGRNPVSIVVPCHRVVGQDGALTGYAGGLDRKQALLELERSVRQAPAAAQA